MCKCKGTPLPLAGTHGPSRRMSGLLGRDGLRVNCSHSSPQVAPLMPCLISYHHDEDSSSFQHEALDEDRAILAMNQCLYNLIQATALRQ